MQNENETDKENAYEFVADLDKLPKAELAGHQWRQQGNQLICMSCTFTHATFIEPGLQLYGIDKQGYPMIRKIEY